MAGKKPDRKPFGRDGPPKGYPKDQADYADPENWRYPLHTPWHAKAARRYFDDASNRSKYTKDEQAYIDSRIDRALERFGKIDRPSSKKRLPVKAPLPAKAEQLSLEQLLRLFLGAPRFQRAKEIDDSLVVISASTPEHLSGRVKEYVVDIDFSKRLILHDCQDWEKNLDSKTMCKHLGKFFLTIDETTSTNYLREVLANINQWTFTAHRAATTNSS
jgi:Family of unknown function (DUF6582)